VTAQTLAQIQHTVQRVLRAEQIPHRWILEHKLFRSTATNPTGSQPQSEPVRYHHLINLSHIPGKTFLYITDPINPATGAVVEQKNAKVASPEAVVVAIPANQSDGFAQLLMYKLSALWTPRLSHTLHGGSMYTYGEFTIRIGDIRSSGPQGQSKGVIVCISQQVPDTDDSEDATDGLKNSTVELDADETNGTNDGEALEIQYKIIREVWERLKIPGAKETVIKTLGRSKQERNFAEVKMWGDLLRFRG
jgi:hypothetical protein